MEVTSTLISFGPFPPALQKLSAHCSYLINIGSLPEGGDWQPSHKEFTVVHTFINVIFLCSSERWLTKYFLILTEINSGNQTRKGTKCHLHSWLANFVTAGFSVCKSLTYINESIKECARWCGFFEFASFLTVQICNIWYQPGGHTNNHTS